MTELAEGRSRVPGPNFEKPVAFAVRLPRDIVARTGIGRLTRLPGG
ncbi:hypothetical protein OSH11_19755 [Kaistia dalseonensis]|uniref:Uncharacterized protein n=1 Tax=Kaistia dalseonensis TaxID=410840 RepID=A0ABU0HBC7_9HYPH|nr:hypothetical protein [Kaistia dalseonensis]MCX5496949.1 hypothetical protein [Kaistia dalseonensis]MDQ0439575.1 hypothetical protein [Kaistia dalseonensis]